MDFKEEYQNPVKSVDDIRDGETLLENAKKDQDMYKSDLKGVIRRKHKSRETKVIIQ